jgi:hypothetical protein
MIQYLFHKGRRKRMQAKDQTAERSEHATKTI